MNIYKLYNKNLDIFYKTCSQKTVEQLNYTYSNKNFKTIINWYRKSELIKYFQIENDYIINSYQLYNSFKTKYDDMTDIPSYNILLYYIDLYTKYFNIDDTIIVEYENYEAYKCNYFNFLDSKFKIKEPFVITIKNQENKYCDLTAPNPTFNNDITRFYSSLNKFIKYYNRIDSLINSPSRYNFKYPQDLRNKFINCDIVIYYFKEIDKYTAKNILPNIPPHVKILRILDKVRKVL